MAELACTHGEVLSPRAAVEEDTETVPLSEALSPSRLGVPSLVMGPWVQVLLLNFLKIELKGRPLPGRALSFLAQGCNSTPAIPAPLAKEKLPLNQANLQHHLTSLLSVSNELAPLRNHEQ